MADSDSGKDWREVMSRRDESWINRDLAGCCKSTTQSVNTQHSIHKRYRPGLLYYICNFSTRPYIINLRTTVLETPTSIKMPSTTQIRTMFRSAAQHLTESHPFARSPVSMKPYPIQYKHLGVRVLRTSAMYVSCALTKQYTNNCRFIPWYAAVLGWPLAAEYMLNGRL
jgi:hypothetical protein